MHSHAPPDDDCPFCNVQTNPDSGAWQRNRMGWVFEQGSVFCMVPTHYWGVNVGNCMIMPKAHFENVYEIDPQVGTDLLAATQRLSLAMKTAFACDGVSTRQHNEPAGNQDVWHYHQHVFPRYVGDDLYGAEKLRYEDDARARLAARLREALGVSA
jgi:histidine triad (HIT) family protein